MIKVMPQEQVDTQDFAPVAPPLHLPDATSTVQGALVQALDYCAQRLSLSSPQEALERARQGDRRALDYCHYRLAQHVAEALGALDDNVQSVSLYNVEATPDDLALGDNPESLPIHMLAWVDRKTSALHSLVAALDRALVKDYAEMVGPRRLRHVLDVQLIDDADVQSRRGIAALLCSLYNRPIQLWQR
jgi:hypothetical protein